MNEYLKYRCHGTYNQNYSTQEHKKYIQTEKWKLIRQQALERDGGKCAICGSNNRLEVHHMTYDNWKDEKLEDLVTLCKVCHRVVHDILTGKGDDFKVIYFDTIFLKPALKNYRDLSVYYNIIRNSWSPFYNTKDKYAEIPKTGYSKMPLNYIMEDVVTVDMEQSGMEFEEHILLAYIGAYHCSFVSNGKQLTPRAILDNISDMNYKELKALVNNYGHFYGLSWVEHRVGARNKVNIVLDKKILTIDKREKYIDLGLIIPQKDDSIEEELFG